MQIQGASRSGRVLPLRSLGRKNGLELQTDVVGRWSSILGANRRLADAKSSMPQENKRDEAYIYVRTFFTRTLIVTYLVVSCFVRR